MLRRQTRPKGFNYQPRYYDPEKEFLREAARSAPAGEEGAGVEGMKRRIAGTFRHRAETRMSNSGLLKNSNRRVFLIIGILAALFYWLLTRHLPQ